MSSTVEAVPNGQEFMRQAEPFDDAEEVVQEAFVLGWRAYGMFEGRSSLRVWLYQIATNACLRALERGGRRALPSGLGAPSRAPHPLEIGGADVTWLQPLPSDPADIVAARSTSVWRSWRPCSTCRHASARCCSCATC